jgi:hypothetical protein
MGWDATRVVGSHFCVGVRAELAALFVTADAAQLAGDWGRGCTAEPSIMQVNARVYGALACRDRYGWTDIRSRGNCVSLDTALI